MRDSAQGNPIFFNEVSKSFDTVQALLPTSLKVGPGEFLTLLGPSGSGKTTLLNIAAGYVSPDRGRVLLGNRDVTHLPPRHRNIGMVFQNYALFPHLNVFDNIAYGLKVRRIPEAEIRTRVRAVLAMVQLEGFEERRIQQLSGGQQQRVALARAMVIRPDLLLMDEPLSALDRQLRKHVQLEIRRIHNEHRRTTIYVTHDQEEALVMSDRIAVMSQGRIEQVGTPTELYREPKNVFVARFLGESNLLPVEIAERSGREISYRVEGESRIWSMQAHDGMPMRNDRALLLVRPEDLTPAPENEPGIEAGVEEAVYLGELTALKLELATGHSVWMRQMGLPPVREGEKMRIRWHPQNVRLLKDTGRAA
ncbi:ABC transporter ATP-binding protein [Chelativorans sp. Marseille-P2723]|uniref:ABC transporter ATP-binding protein n=1 Tax=Chelativorans sp. Marseille-P2723 TaxID=2709133 RepID=UPI00156DA19F|nr:ABC transporter ATP-binding protein [Chelativorans sp. Marseille-P2723]